MIIRAGNFFFDGPHGSLHVYPAYFLKLVKIIICMLIGMFPETVGIVDCILKKAMRVN